MRRCLENRPSRGHEGVRGELVVHDRSGDIPLLGPHARSVGYYDIQSPIAASPDASIRIKTTPVRVMIVGFHIGFLFHPSLDRPSSQADSRGNLFDDHPL